MILGQETGGECLLIIDDNAAKKTAKYLSLTVTGTMGVLLKAQKVGIIECVKPILEEIKKQGFYISENVERLVLQQAGEDAD